MSSDESETPESIKQDALGIAFDNLLPEKSKEKYLKVYNDFEEWKNTKGAKSVSESVLIVYFQHLSAKFKSSSLWTIYSMLKSVINIKHDIQINTYTKLLAFLRRKSDGQLVKKTKVFTKQDVDTFLYEAPDHNFLVVKVALIFGVNGGCRSNELVNMKISDIEKLSDSLLVHIPDSKTKKVRTFNIHEAYARFVEKYLALRPSKMNTDRLFISYSNGKCARQVIGKNKIAAMAKVIAKYLKLENPELYMGHCFRKTSASLLLGSGADMTEKKRHGGRKFEAIAEGSEQVAQPGPSKAQGTRTSLNSSASIEQDPLSGGMQQCRFCGEFSNDCVSVSGSMPYLAANQTTLVLNHTRVQLDFNNHSLPSTVCRNCDAKLRDIAKFLKAVKTAQDTLINVAQEREVGIEIEVVKQEAESETENTETLFIKTEYDSPHEESDTEQKEESENEDDKEGIVDSLSVGETVFVKKSVTHKRKTDAVTEKPKKIKVETCDSELIIDIKEEVIEKGHGQGQSGVSDSDVKVVKPSELGLATSALVFEMAGDGTSEHQGYRSDR